MFWVFVLVSDPARFVIRFTPFMTLNKIIKEASAINSLGCFLMSQQKKSAIREHVFLLLLLIILEFLEIKKERKTSEKLGSFVYCHRKNLKLA